MASYFENGRQSEASDAAPWLMLSAVFRNDPAYRRFFRLWQEMNLGLAAIFGNFLNMPLARTFELYKLCNRSWDPRGVYSRKNLLQLLAVVLASFLIVSSALAGELGALCLPADRRGSSVHKSIIRSGLMNRERSLSEIEAHRPQSLSEARPER
jgi:hypothetical protein